MKHELGTITVTAEIREESADTIETFSDVVAKYRCLGEEQKEHMYAVFLTNGNEELGDKLIGLGSNDTVQFDIQDVARTAVLVNAGAVILVHNHPSGNAQPTQQDINATKDVNEVLDILGIQLLDHVIITRNGSHSMKANEDGPFNDEATARG